MASEKRKAVVLEHMVKLKKGMSRSEVIELMTYPDEVNLTYKFKYAKAKENVIGFSLVYILRRNAASGSFNEKKEQLLRIHFDTFGQLYSAYAIDINEFNPI